MSGIVSWPAHWPAYHNACSTPCDCAEGPCCCGATHGEGEFVFVEGTLYRYGEAVAGLVPISPTLKHVVSPDANERMIECVRIATEDASLAQESCDRISLQEIKDPHGLISRVDVIRELPAILYFDFEVKHTDLTATAGDTNVCELTFVAVRDESKRARTATVKIKLPFSVDRYITISECDSYSGFVVFLLTEMQNCRSLFTSST